MSNKTPRERLEESLTSPYDPEEQTWSALLTALANEFDDHEQTLDDVFVEKFIDSATGEQLNKIASLFEMERRGSETVAAFRARVKTGLRAQLTSATVDEIKEVAALLLNADTSEIILEERFTFGAAQFYLDVGEVISGEDISEAEFINTISSVVAAGVGVGILAKRPESDTLVLDDTQVVGDRVEETEAVKLVATSVVDDDVTETESFGFADTGTVSDVDPPTQAFWNDSAHNFDFYDTALASFLVEAFETVGLVDSAGFPEVLETEAVELTDTEITRIETVSDSVWNEARMNIDAYVTDR